MTAIDLESCIQENTNNPLLKIISQGLNKPVATLLFHIQKLNENCIHDSLTYDTLSLCEESLKILTELIDDVNFLYSIENPEKRPSLDWCVIKSQVNKVIQELKLKFPNVGDISTKISFTNRFIYVDEHLLRKVLFNLLSNALKFSWKSRIYLVISSVNSGLEINVRDFGIGIPEREIEGIFCPFIRGSNSGYKPGWGLGLTVLSKALADLKGTIEVRSIVGQGSEFKVFIPCKISNEMKYDIYYS
jgi:K+-sensing histidine kinase KdpD